MNERSAEISRNTLETRIVAGLQLFQALRKAARMPLAQQAAAVLNARAGA